MLLNHTLFEGLAERLRKADLEVPAQRRIPANDGRLVLGQAAIAAARLVAQG